MRNFINKTLCFILWHDFIDRKLDDDHTEAHCTRCGVKWIINLKERIAEVVCN